MESLNPFDDDRQICYILCNDEQQYSLWPDFCAIPAGWSGVFGPTSRGECVGWLEQHWQDMRPVSQRKA